MAGAQQLVSDELLCAEKHRFQQMVRFRGNPDIHYGYNIHYHRCHWRVNPGNGYLKGSVTSYIYTTTSSDSIGFDMKAQLPADSVVWNKQKIRFTRSGDIIYCYKPGGWQPGLTDSLTIYYQGKPAIFAGGLGYYVRDDHATGPLVYTLSQPYGAPYWWPCKQTLSDKVDSMDIILSVDTAYRAASNGKLLADKIINDTTRLFHWKHRYPIATYLVAIAVTNYTAFTQWAKFHNRNDSLEVLNYVFPQSLATLKQDAIQTLPMLRLFDSLFGEYPFMKEKYGHAQFTRGGGMEHQTMSFMVNFSYDLTAHELAHMWFGDMVTCGSWRDLWLNEGFATYLTALCYQYLKGEGDFRGAMRGLRNSATSADDGSIFPADTITVNRLFSSRLTYNKAAFVLHMLRWEVGDKAYFDALRKFLYGKSRYGFASTEDLKSLMEQESGKNLDTFFLRWYKGEGFPYLNINWQQRGRMLNITVKQRPSHPTVPFFPIDVPLMFSGENQDSLIVLRPTKTEQTFTFELPFAADTALFDPQVRILAKASVGGLNQDKVIDDALVLLGNPVVNQKLSIATLNIKAEEIKIFDYAGRQVYGTNESFSHRPGADIEIPLEHLPAGSYIVKIYSRNSVNSLKFIKTK